MDDVCVCVCVQEEAEKQQHSDRKIRAVDLQRRTREESFSHTVSARWASLLN